MTTDKSQWRRVDQYTPGRPRYEGIRIDRTEDLVDGVVVFDVCLRCTECLMIHEVKVAVLDGVVDGARWLRSAEGLNGTCARCSHAVKAMSTLDRGGALPEGVSPEVIDEARGLALSSWRLLQGDVRPGIPGAFVAEVQEITSRPHHPITIEDADATGVKGWARTKPTEPGWYWLLRWGYSSPHAVKVFAPEGYPEELWLRSHGGKLLEIGKAWDAQTVWCGPFEVPPGWEAFVTTDAPAAPPVPSPPPCSDRGAVKPCAGCEDCLPAESGDAAFNCYGEKHGGPIVLEHEHITVAAPAWCPRCNGGTEPPKTWRNWDGHMPCSCGAPKSRIKSAAPAGLCDDGDEVQCPGCGRVGHIEADGQEGWVVWESLPPAGEVLP